MNIKAGIEWNFNPLPRKEGDQLIVKPSSSSATHFNPLPRKEGDQANFAKI